MNSRSDWPRQVPLAGRRGNAEWHAGMPTHPSFEAVRTRRLTGSIGKTAVCPKWDWSVFWPLTTPGAVETAVQTGEPRLVVD